MRRHTVNDAAFSATATASAAATAAAAAATATGTATATATATAAIAGVVKKSIYGQNGVLSVIDTCVVCIVQYLIRMLIRICIAYYVVRICIAYYVVLFNSPKHGSTPQTIALYSAMSMIHLLDDMPVPGSQIAGNYVQNNK